jgi:hypothetical protein
MANKTTIMIQDVGGSFKRFLEQAPEEARMLINDAVEKTAFSMQQRMKANAPSGPNGRLDGRIVSGDSGRSRTL